MHILYIFKHKWSKNVSWKWVSLLLVFLNCSGYALPLGSPNETCLFKNGLWRSPECFEPCYPTYTWFEGWNIRAGYYGDFVFNRHLSTSRDTHIRRSSLDKTEIFTHAAYVVVNFSNFCRNIDLFATLGASNFRTRQNSRVFTEDIILTERDSELKFSPAFSWSVGARSALFYYDCFTLGIEAQYFTAEPKLDRFVFADDRESFHFRDKGSHYEEWQVGLGLSYLISIRCHSMALIPYAGFKYSRAKWELGDALFPDTTIPLGSFESKEHWGWAFGFSFTMCQLVGMTMEGRFADEKAFHVKGQVRF